MRGKGKVAELCDILRKSGAVMTFSRHCRSGLIGDMCRCWRCRGLGKPQFAEDPIVEREARLADRAFNAGFQLGTYKPKRKA